jgi:hypothetical protein
MVAKGPVGGTPPRPAAPPPGPPKDPADAMPEMTMVQKGPMPKGPGQKGPPPGAPPIPRGQEETSNAASPMRTMPIVRPGGTKPPPGDAIEQTLVQGGPMARSPQAPPPPGSPPPPAAPTPPPPAAPPPAAATPAPGPALGTPDSQAAGRKPSTTVFVEPANLEAELGRARDENEARAVDVEARLHEALPRVFVKCDGLKRRVRLVKARNSLGRAESADVLLPVESVSELHAEITFDGVTWTMRDRGSTNGGVVDGTHLRGDSQTIARHSLICLGTVRAIFFCENRQESAAQLRLEERAVKELVKDGRLQADAAAQAIRLARADQNQSVAELLLMDTPLLPAEWASAVATARSRRGLGQLLSRLWPFGRKASKRT